MNYVNKVGFAIGTGRCGTLFLHKLCELEPDVASSHERNQDNEAFHRYCKWHELPVDSEGFLRVKAQEIDADLQTHAFSFEASPYLSLSLKELHERFNCKFVLLIRRPDGVVTSFAHKGFYRNPYFVRDASLATGYQDQSPEKMHTFFARIAPRGEFFHTWNAMTQVGKVAWFWRAWNERTLDLLAQLPRESYRVVRIEDLNYEKYYEIARFLGYEPAVSRHDFENLRTARPHAFWRKRNIDEWSTQEVEEFESQVGDLARKFGYEYRVNCLVDEIRAEKEMAIEKGFIQKPKPRKMWRLRRSSAQILRQVANLIDVG